MLAIRQRRKDAVAQERGVYAASTCENPDACGCGAEHLLATGIEAALTPRSAIFVLTLAAVQECQHPIGLTDRSDRTVIVTDCDASVGAAHVFVAGRELFLVAITSEHDRAVFAPKLDAISCVYFFPA